MPGDVGAVATAINTVASWFMSADGYAAFQKRRALASKKQEVKDALARGDWDAVRNRVAELERLSNAP